MRNNELSKRNLKRIKYQNNLKGKYIDFAQKGRYFERLITPYNKSGKQKFYIEQYIHGDGKELKEKFWSKRSSSRFAFELYSWLADDKNCVDIEFEFKLPTLKGYSVGAPNMDVYIETKEKRILIESKFLESSKISLDNLSKSYDLDQSLTVNKKELSLLNRYYDDEDLKSESVKFIDGATKLINENLKGKEDFFDIKQEVNHLIGIAFQLHLNSDWTKKPLQFFNVVYQFDDDNENDNVNKFREDFIELGNNYINKLYKGNGFKFEYGIKTTDDFLYNDLKLSKNQIAFGCSDGTTVLEKLKSF
ncbi:MAG: hypothetical protein IKQ18_04545, partial [Clostridia bacterium]|nr:hypothetical protein [Clostridia bacterium]